MRIAESEAVKTGKQSEQTIYGLTSLPVEEFGAAELLAYTRNHWSIENGLHYRRNVTFHEDAVRQTAKSGGRVLATFNNLTIGVLRHAVGKTSRRPADISRRALRKL